MMMKDEIESHRQLLSDNSPEPELQLLFSLKPKIFSACIRDKKKNIIIISINYRKFLREVCRILYDGN